MKALGWSLSVAGWVSIIFIADVRIFAWPGCIIWLGVILIVTGSSIRSAYE
jgi:hypothetical protein